MREVKLEVVEEETQFDMGVMVMLGLFFFRSVHSTLWVSLSLTCAQFNARQHEPYRQLRLCVGLCLKSRRGVHDLSM